jgi:hypothetical protein
MADSYVLIVQMVVFSVSTMASQNPLRLCTYNSRGHGPGRLDYIRLLMSKCDVLFIQEHWYFDTEISSLESSIGNIQVYGVSGMDDTELLTGRPFGGCAILINNDLKCKFTPIQLNKRSCGGIITVGSISILIFNVYMPCDKAYNINNLDLYREVLSDISDACNAHDVDYMIIGGDFNTDLRRTNSSNTQVLNSFVNDECLSYCISLDLSDVKYTYENDSTQTESTIDHFIVSDNLTGYVLEYCSLHDANNMSDHAVVLMTLNVNSEHFNDRNCRHFDKRAQWEKATEYNKANYKNKLDELLSHIKIPLDALYCQHVFCNDHTTDLNEYCDLIIHACLTASDMCIPCTRKKVIAGWNEVAEPVRNEAMFWHGIWLDNGRPKHGIVADIRRRTRAKYKQVVKALKRDQGEQMSKKLSTSLQSNCKRDFWKEAKRIGGKNQSLVNMIDGEHGNDNISKVFASNYRELYNSVPFDKKDMDKLLSKLAVNIDVECMSNKCYSSHVIKVNDVIASMAKLKIGKSDGVNNLRSDALINGCDSLFTHISLLFSALLKHGFTPNNMLLATLIPIPKNKRKCLNDSSNYRAIALGSILSKVLDVIIMDKNANIFTSSELQFGFKAKHSTTQCSFVVEEVIDFYNRNESPVYLVTLDASRAFDRVEYCKLFQLLIDRNICSLYARLLIYMYTRLKLRVRWNGKFSEMFKVCNGVKQGGILSPILFCIYIDVLLDRLKHARVGCFIGNNFIGCVGYADDVCLVAPSCRATRVLLSICEEFGEEYMVKFNSSKSYITVCSKEPKIFRNDFTMNGKAIPLRDSVTHLGHHIGNSECKKSVIDKGISDLVTRTNYVLAKFGCCDSNVRNFLFRTYCTNYYGSPLWSLSNQYIEKFYCSWRKCVRRVWNVPRNTHCRFLKTLYGGNYIAVQLLLRFLTFFHSVLGSENHIVVTCANICATSHSVVATNRRKLLFALNDDGQILTKPLPLLKSQLISKGSDFINCSHANVIKELCLMRDGLINTDLNSYEIITLLHDLCTQ